MVNDLTNPVVLNPTLAPSSPPPTLTKRLRSSQQPYYPGELGKLALQNAEELARRGWHHFFLRERTPTSISSTLHRLPHPIRHYLERLAATGAPSVLRTPPWSLQEKDCAVLRGPHTSAARQHRDFLLSEMYEYVTMGYWTVLPYTALRHHPALRLAPAGVVPQRDRRPRPIIDYSFYNTNTDAQPIAPYHAMQFGATLPRLLQRLAYCNRAHGPPLLAKLDLADGYYRVPLSSTAALHLAVVLPSDGLPQPLIAIPLTLPMGWAHSPPFFCAFTETVTDIANYAPLPTSLHPLMPFTAPRLPASPTWDPSAVTLYNPSAPPLRHTDVYIDDFIVVAQQPLAIPTINRTLHAIDTVFSDPPHTNRKQIISQSKLDKGDAILATSKTILGWNIDTERMTITLPDSRLETLQKAIKPLCLQRRTTLKKWRALLGTMRSATTALYGGEHLFSILQQAFQSAKHNRITLTALLKAMLHDWLVLADTMTKYPVPIHALVPRAPDIVTATDASRVGMGGFWLQPSPHTPQHIPVLWRTAFDTDIQSQLITAANPNGTITNSDLELAAIITGTSLANHHLPIAHPSILVASDNIPAVTWCKKGSTSSTTPAAFLLHLLANTRRAAPYTVQPLYIPGHTNQIADCCSRLLHLPDDAFLEYMNQRFPVQPSWTLVHPSKEQVLLMKSALFKKLLRLASPPELSEQETQHGTYGKTSATTSTKTPHWPISMIPFHFCSSLLNDTGWARLLPVEIKSVLERWKAPFVPLGRRFPHWASTTHV
jgi:hypothetical protein